MVTVFTIDGDLDGIERELALECIRACSVNYFFMEHFTNKRSRYEMYPSLNLRFLLD